MKYRIEDIIDYVDSVNAGSHRYSFCIREQSSPYADYGNEAVIYTNINDNHIGNMGVGIIFEFNPFNPHIYYTKQEVVDRLDWLEQKAKRILSYYGGKRIKKE